MGRPTVFLSSLCLGLFLIAGCSRVNDDTINTSIKAKMFSDPSLKGVSLDVTSKDGVVTITGLVPDDSTRVAARTIASSTTGVKQVIDATTLAPPAPPVAESTPPPPTPAPILPLAKSPSHKRPTARQPEPAPASAPDDSEASSATPASDSSPAPASATPPSAPTAPAPPPPPTPPQPVSVTIPEGTVVAVRTIDSIDSIDSSTSSSRQIFRASLDAPVVANDQVVFPRGLNVNLKIINASSAGKFAGTSELTVALESLTYQGKTYTLETSDVQEKGSSRGKRSAAVIGGGTVLGALIGGLAGGGKGAAIGAAAGGGAGTAVQASTHGQQVKIPSETHLDFTLHSPVPVTYFPKQTPARASPDANAAPSAQSSPDSSQQSNPPPQQ